MSKTACVVPWTTFVILPNGGVSFCCAVGTPLSVDGRLGTVYRDSLDDLWNAPELLQVRANIARGEKPEACRSCWEMEAAGGVSRRLFTNEAYRQCGERLAIDSVALEGARTGYRLDRRPNWFMLALGNICDLKCRSCSSLFSSRISADPVHSAWGANRPATAPGEASARPLETVPQTPAWFRNIDALADMIAGGAEGDSTLSLLGGETFLADSTWRLLGALVDRGVAPRFLLGLVTNGQHRSAELEKLAPHFRGLGLSLSIDAYGKLYEYLRHGARWHRVVENLSWFRQVPKLTIAAIPTFQNCNALDMPTLLRFLDQQQVPLAFNALEQPRRLLATNLPPSVRRVAAARLRGYLKAECKPANAAVVRNYCEILEGAGDDFDAALFREFMAFTNDLDASRGESLAEVAPELVALVRAAGIEWSDERRYTRPADRPASRQGEWMRRVNRTISSQDATFAPFEAGGAGSYFSTGLDQLADLDARLRRHGHPGLAGSRAVADFACHYGRMTRALRVMLPHAAVYACDIDPEAVQFCASELGALPVLTGWRPDEDRLPGDLDVVVCVSLLTHTPLEHWRSVLRAWMRMLRPGGIAAFTFLSESYADGWLAGSGMEVYGTYPDEMRSATVDSLRKTGHGFAPLTSDYGGQPLYGIAFATGEVVRREIEAAGFDLLELATPTFPQDLALVRKPPEKEEGQPAASSAVRRDVSAVAFYDPRCYSPAKHEEGSHTESAWVRLAAADPQCPLPTELGFCDPRVPEVRKAQAALAREHGVDAFCYVYRWAAGGPRWDAPWRDMVASGQPDFPFCLMIEVEDLKPISAAAARSLFEAIAAGLRDSRYLRVEGRSLLMVRDVAKLAQPRAVAAAWRAAASAGGTGELHLCATEPASGVHPADLGFDSFLEAPPALDYAAAAGAAVVRPWPGHRFFRAVECRRDASEPHALEWYEHWLRSTIDATRSRGETLVFIDSWNDWLRRAYLEPDDRDGRAALLATRRAARGPGSGLVLLRQLRDALGDVGGRAAGVLEELEQVLGLHEHTRDRLLASVEVALGRDCDRRELRQDARWLAVATRQLRPSSGGGFSLDRVGSRNGTDLWGAKMPIRLSGSKVSMAGWAHAAIAAPGGVDLFLAFESADETADYVLRLPERIARPDVVAAFPGYPVNCGFDQDVDIAHLPPGAYRVAIVQRTFQAAYRDATAVVLKLGESPCSND